MSNVGGDCDGAASDDNLKEESSGRGWYEGERSDEVSFFSGLRRNGSDRLLGAKESACRRDGGEALRKLLKGSRG